MYIISNYPREVFLKLPSHQEIVSRNRLSSKNVMINKLAKVFINCKACFTMTSASIFFSEWFPLKSFLKLVASMEVE